MNTKLQKVLGALLMLIALPVSAYDLEIDGIYYTVTSFTDFTCSVTYGDKQYKGTVVIPPTIVYNGRTLTVTGVEENAFSRYGTSSTLRDNAIHSLTIPNTISSIPNDALYYCTSLDSLIIQDGDTEIDLGRSSKHSSGNNYHGPLHNTPTSYIYVGRNLKKRRYCYYSSNYNTQNYYYYDQFYSTNIKVAEIGDKVTSMPFFYKSEELEKVILSKESDIEIGDSIFMGCSKLSDISENNNVSKIGNKSFYECSNLKSISFPNAQTIGYYAFYNCQSLESVSIPNAQTIGFGAFSSCSNLESVSIPNAQTIGYDAFEKCSNLASVSIPNAQTIGSSAFYGCSSLASVSIPNAKTIGGSAFYGCSSLKSVSIPNAQTIGTGALGNTAITDIVIPNRVKVLNDIFPNCIQSITLGDSIESIASGAFTKSGLKTINIYTATPPTLSESACGNAQYLNVNVNVPVGAKEAYMNADVWKNFWSINEVLSTGIESIADTSADLAFSSTSDGIILSGADGQNVKVYGIGGEEVLSISNYHGQSLSLPKGIYIVKAGKKALKVRL